MKAFVALFDHKNIKASGLSLVHVLSKWLATTAESQEQGLVIDVFVRTYGGWYDETMPSSERAAAIIYYQNELPSLFSVGRRFFRTHLVFADSLVDPTGHSSSACALNFTHTSMLRPSELVSVVRKSPISCTMPTCKLGEVRRWISRRKACAEHGCPHDYSTFFERREQKQVDVHIATDLITLSRGSHEVALASSDNDFIPAVAAFSFSATRSNLTWVRPLGDTFYADSILKKMKIKLIFL